MAVEVLIMTTLGTIIAAASVGTYREARHARRRIEKHERQLNGTEARPGLVQRVRELHETVHGRRRRDA
jgi:uncharacterized protein (DUF2236 family)